MTPSKALLGYELARRGEWGIPIYQEDRQKRDDAKARRKIIRTRQLDFEHKTYPEQYQQPPVTFRKGGWENHPTNPFAPAWSGPHSVTVRWSPQIYEVDKNGRQYKYHVDQLRPAPPGNPESPENSETEEEEKEDPRRAPQEIDDASFSEDEGPIRITTEVLVHVAPRPRDMGRPAGTGVEHCATSPPGTSTLTHTLPDSDEIRVQEPVTIADPERPRTPVEEDQPRTPAEDIVILRRPRRRKPSSLTLQPQEYIGTER